MHVYKTSLYITMYTTDMNIIYMHYVYTRMYGYIYMYIQLNIQPITKVLLSVQSNVGVSNIMIITPNENWYPPHIIQ